MDEDYDTLLKKYANKSERPKDEEEGALDEHEDQSRDRRRKESDKRRTDKSRDKRDRSRDRRRSRERSRDRRRSSRERERSRDRKRSRERSRDRMEIDAEIAAESQSERQDENKWGGLRERSVDEWDVLRAELGLPPLEKSASTNTAANTAAPSSAEVSEEREMSLADKLEVMKHARLMKQKEKKLKTLGDADSDEEERESAAVDWIQRSRAIEQEKKRALMRQRMLEEEEEQARALRPVTVQGLKVGHELTQLDHDLREGEERVLTLKDNYILDENGQEDELLDTTLLEKEKWEKIHNAKKKKSRYELLDDPQASVLSKYDEEKKTEGFVLSGEGPVAAPTARPSADEVRDKLQRAAQSLDTPAPSTGSDYWTNEEIAEFKKNTAPKKKKRKLRKKSALSELFEQEAAHPQQGADEDLASRTARQQRQEEQSAQDRDTRLQRWKNYDKALEKAQGDAHMLFDQPKRSESEVSYHEDEDDLFRELARARKLAARDKKKKRPEEVVSELLTTAKREDESAVTNNNNDEELVFTESTEFVRSLPTEQDERQEEQERKMKRERRTVQVKKEPVPERDEDTLMREIEADQPVIRPPAPRRVESEELAVKEEKPDTSAADSDSVQKEHAALSEALGDTGGEVRGVGGMLAMLRSMGESGGASTNTAKEKKKDKEERRPKQLDAELALGRATDKRVLEVPLHDEREVETLQRRHRHELGMLKKPLNLNSITLEHHDQETGRLLTPKEAFRRMSYVFHGKGPGKNKAEKRKKQDEKRLKQLTQHSMGTETISMAEMSKIQQENKTPYIVLGASAKIFQARDTKPLSTPSTSNNTTHNNNNNNNNSVQSRDESEYGISLPSHRPKIELSFKTPAKK